MLEGVVPFPPDFARRYREKGYWRDKSLAEEFKAVFEKYADRTVIIDGETRLSYRELDALSTNLALNFLDLGLEPLDQGFVPHDTARPLRHRRGRRRVDVEPDRRQSLRHRRDRRR